MKCFILKTQDDLSNELYERWISSLSLPWPSILVRGSTSGQHVCSCGGHGAGRAACFSGRSQQIQFLEAAFAVFLHCMRFGNECKNVLWAFTFLCQSGLYCLDLLLTWGGTGDSAVWSQHGICLRRPAKCWYGDWWSGKRLGTFSEEIISKCVHLMWSWQIREEPSQKDGLDASCIINSTLVRGSV